MLMGVFWPRYFYRLHFNRDCLSMPTSECKIIYGSCCISERHPILEGHTQLYLRSSAKKETFSIFFFFVRLRQKSIFFFQHFPYQVRDWNFHTVDDAVTFSLQASRFRIIIIASQSDISAPCLHNARAF